jgi:DNA modification methylase
MSSMDIQIGDCVTLMNTMDEKTVDLIVTSPPYFQQRDYEAEGQIGRETTVEDYVATMVVWANACKRVLKDTGSLFLNIGDKYENKGLLMIPERLTIAMLSNGWVLRNKIVWYKPNHMPSSVKDRFCATWEPVYFFTKDSGKYYNYPYHCNLDVLREAPTTESKIPFPRTLSLEEYPDWTERITEFNANKVSKGKFKNAGVNKGASPGARQQTDVVYSRMRKHDMSEEKNLEVHGYLKECAKAKKQSAKKLDETYGYKSKAGHWLRLDHGRSLPDVEDYRRLKGILELDDRYDAEMLEEHYVLQSVQNNPKGKTPEDLWSIPLTHEKGIDHFAMFPLELPKRIIQVACPPGGLVLDPFAGSGTTGLAAQQLGVRCCLMELNPEFVELIRRRTGEHCKDQGS